MSTISLYASRLPRRAVPILVAAMAVVLVLVALAFAPNDRSSSDSIAPAADPGRQSSGTTTNETLVDPAAPADIQGDLGGGGTELRAEDAIAPSTAKVATAADGVAPQVSGIAPQSSGFGVPEIDAKIVRTGSIELRVRHGRFERVWGDAQAVAGGFGGYVIAASRSGAGGDDGRVGTITMRVPSGRFDRAVDRLREIPGAKVTQLDDASQDVTQEFVDVRSRLRHDRLVEGRLIAVMARTTTVSEVLAVQARLDQVQEQIEIERGRLTYLEKLTSMSTIDLTIRERSAKGGDETDDDPSVLGSAWGDARARFSENVASVIVWFGGALPALVLLALIAFVARLGWRRRTARTAANPGSVQGDSE
jgi:hypothetical protein